jgi:hypothetical protein
VARPFHGRESFVSEEEIMSLLRMASPDQIANVMDFNAVVKKITDFSKQRNRDATLTLTWEESRAWVWGMAIFSKTNLKKG